MSDMALWRDSRQYLICSIIFWGVVFIANLVRIVIESRRHDHINTAIAVCFVVMGPVWIWDALRKLRGSR